MAKRYLRPVVTKEESEDKGEEAPPIEEDGGDNGSGDQQGNDESNDHTNTIETMEASLDDNNDEDTEAVKNVQKKVSRRKFTDAEAIEWVEEQIHHMRLKEEEDAIAAEYAELQQQMANLETAHEEALKEPDQEERQIQMMMSTVEKEHDAEMLTHKNKDNQKLEKVKKSRRKSRKDP